MQRPLLIYSVILVRSVALASTGSIVRLSVYIFMLYFFHFGIIMGDFRFLYSFKFLLALSLVIFIEVGFLSSEKNKNFRRVVSFTLN